MAAMAPVDDNDKDEEEEEQPKVPKEETVFDQWDGKVDSVDGWDELMEGKIRKRVVKAGSGEPPEVNSDVRCSYDVFLLAEDGNYTGAKPLQRYQHYRYRIGEGEAVPALELVLRHMQPNEEAEVTCISRFAWGPEGCAALGPGEKEIPADADIRLLVTLLECIPAKRGRGDPQQKWIADVQEVEWRKNNGNDHYKRHKLQKALKCYEKGLDVFPEMPIKAPVILGRSADSASAACTKLVADCASNIAAVRLEFNEPSKAKEFAKICNELVPDHAKGLYRSAKAFMLLGDFDSCEKDLQRLLKLQPRDPEVRKLDNDLRKASKKYAIKTKRIGAKILEAFSGRAPDQPEEPKLTVDNSWLAWAVDLMGHDSPKAMYDEYIIYWKQMIAGAGLILLAVFFIWLAPRDYFPIATVTSAIGVPCLIGVGSALWMPPEAIEKEKKLAAEAKIREEKAARDKAKADWMKAQAERNGKKPR